MAPRSRLMLPRRTKTKEAYQKWLKRIDDKIKKILEEAEATDAKE